MIVPAANAPLARELVVVLAGEPAANMFTTGLSPTGDEPFTHFISSGMIEDTFGAVLTDPALMASLCVNAGRQITEVECAALLAACDISEDDPFVALERLNLVMLTAEQLAERAAARQAANGGVVLNG
jgi:hypothetical protein